MNKLWSFPELDVSQHARWETKWDQGKKGGKMT